MGLYTRKDYERDCKQIDSQIAKSASLLGEQLIGPLQHYTRARQLDELKRKLGQKLAMTAIALKDKSNMERSDRFAWVIGAKKIHEDDCRGKRGEHYCNCNGSWYVTRKKEPLIKHGQPHYRDTSLNEIEALQRDGVTVMESGFMKKKSKDMKVEETPVMPLTWVEVASQQEAEKFQNLGHYYTGKDGKQYWAAHYMVKSEGEGDNRKFYVTDVR